MIKIIDETYYIPMKDFKKLSKEQEEYFDYLDDKYGVGLSIRDWRNEYDRKFSKRKRNTL